MENTVEGTWKLPTQQAEPITRMVTKRKQMHGHKESMPAVFMPLHNLPQNSIGYLCAIHLTARDSHPSGYDCRRNSVRS